MTRYLVRHHVTRIYASQDDLVNDWKGLRARTHPDAQWLNSWYASQSDRLICEWEAASPEAIRGCFLPVELEMAPIEEVDEVVAVDPAWLDEAGPPEAPGGGSPRSSPAPSRIS